MYFIFYCELNGMGNVTDFHSPTPLLSLTFLSCGLLLFLINCPFLGNIQAVRWNVADKKDHASTNLPVLITDGDYFIPPWSLFKFYICRHSFSWKMLIWCLKISHSIFLVSQETCLWFFQKGSTCSSVPRLKK